MSQWAHPKLRDRFMNYVAVKAGGGCWIWTGYTNRAGYGRFWANGKVRQAHMVSYFIHRGLFDAGLELDHICRVKCCVNPDHLEPVTHKENTLRGEGACAKFARRTHCKRGHELSGDNIRKNSKDGHRGRCMACKLIYPNGRGNELVSNA
jgi:hypothetical protein